MILTALNANAEFMQNHTSKTESMKTNSLNKSDKVGFVNPFTIDIDPMERLLLINFEKDADSVYIGFEPQVFDDPVNGKGHLVIGWRKDGKIDIYHQSSLNMRPEKYDIAGKGVNEMVLTDMAIAFFEVTNLGIQAEYVFRDLSDREVNIRIIEKNTKTRKPFGLLAPLGHAAENPSSMPVILLQDFYFVRKQHTKIHIKIDNKEHQADFLPIPMDGQKMYFTRYSPKPQIATLNSAFNGVLKSTEITKGNSEITDGDYRFEISWNGESPQIKSITKVNDIHPIKLNFNPAFPDLSRIGDDEALKGHFVIEGHPSTGSVGGYYEVNRIDDQLFIKMVPSKGWKPVAPKLSLRFMYTVVKTFKRWPTTYSWQADLNVDNTGNWIMQSEWERLN